MMIKQLCKIEHLLFCLLCAVSVFAYSQRMTDTYIVPKWCFTIAVMLFVVVTLSIKKLFNKEFQIDIPTWSYVIVITCLVQALYGVWQWFEYVSSPSGNKVVGSFDNPAGFAACLCLGLPFVLLCLKSTKKRALLIGIYMVALIIVSAIVMSESRSGIVSSAVFTCILLGQYIPLKARSKIILFICAFVLLLGGSYFLKRNSADGRFLIWKCSWEMAKDSPVWGHGADSFKAHYMDYQAEYFKKHPDSKYTMLADNVLSPFNEYLVVLLNFGFVGLFLLFTLGSFLVFSYYKSPNDESRVALLSLVGISIFSFFSYPFTYPFTWIVTCLSIYILIKGYFTLHITTTYQNLLCVISLVLCLGFSYKLHQRIQAERRWGEIAYQHATNKILSDYMGLANVLGENPYFLYNYAVILLDENHLGESLEKALRCRLYWRDYDLELLLGDIYKTRKEYMQAEIYYKNASLMCPCRFIPLYQLFELYKEMRCKEKVLSTAKLIIEKPVKIQSSTVRQIKRNVRKEIEQCYENK